GDEAILMIEIADDDQVSLVAVSQVANMQRGRNREDDAARDAGVVAVLDVAPDALLGAVPLRFLVHLAAELERVAAGSGVEKVRRGHRRLFPVAIGLAARMRAGNLQRRRIAPEVRLAAVRNPRIGEPEIAVT